MSQWSSRCHLPPVPPMQGAGKPSGAQCLAQGHFNKWTRGGGDRTAEPVTSGRPDPPPEPQASKPRPNQVL